VDPRTGLDSFKQDMSCVYQDLNPDHPSNYNDKAIPAPLIDAVQPKILKAFCFWSDSPQWARASSFLRFLDHT
jgi:hypothetical protein